MGQDVLVYEKKNDLFTTSDIVADRTNTARKSVRSLIRKYKHELEEFGKLSDSQLAKSTGGRRAEFYLLNEQQATFLLTLLRNNDVVIKFKIALVKEFYRMRSFILERQSIEWQQQRAIGKLSRKAETDILKQLVEYAKKQGSLNSEKLYITYSSLVKKLLGYKSRDTATGLQISSLTIMEEMILHCVKDAMEADMHYKEIYQLCKKKLNDYMVLTYQDRKAIA